MYPPCTRCGMCCMITPCAFSGVEDGEDCPYLQINEDLTTTCSNKAAVEQYVNNGGGCIFMSEGAEELYELHLEFYCINQRKREALNVGIHKEHNQSKG